MKQMVIFDIDGTIADNNHRVPLIYTDMVRDSKGTLQGKKNWDAFFAAQHLDTPRQDVLFVLDMYVGIKPEIHIAILTGRGQEWESVTVEWLERHGVQYDSLTMRATGDRTDDTKIKMDHIIEWQKQGYEIIGFFEDRRRICDAARAHGITVFQMDAGDF